MKKLGFLRLALGLAMAMWAAGSAHAYNAAHFTTTSLLATGNWVKIAIPECGIYEITYDELVEMGFANPEQVRLYGKGGIGWSETLDGSHDDDIKPAPMMRVNDKLIFYGQGPEQFTLNNPLTTPYFSRRLNGYSSYGYYFLTDSETGLDEIDIPVVAPASNLSSTPISTSYDYFWHESELSTLSNSGRTLLGEDIADNNVFVDFYLPHLSSPDITLQTTAAGKVTASSYIETYIHTGDIRQDAAYTMASSVIQKPSDQVYYHTASPRATITLDQPEERGQIEVGMYSPSGIINSAKLDYIIATYQHTNIIPDDADNQMRMTAVQLADTARLVLPGASATTMVWDVTDAYRPKAMTMLPWQTGDQSFAPGYNARYASFVAFDPAQTLKKVAKFEPVPNQNLHGLETPNLLIITNQMFMEQAMRMARMHEAVDGITVAVIDQEQVFNEFSSGRRDPMALRLLCKMFYDRGGTTFQNLLLFGGASFDNRNILQNHGFAVINYEMDEANISTTAVSESATYTTDDFFAFLTDGDSNKLSSSKQKLVIGVGRITCRDAMESKRCADKQIGYYANPDYGTWRNNMMITCDAMDDGLHMFQAEGIVNIIKTELKPQMQINKVYCPIYPRAVDEPRIGANEKTATEGKRHWTELSQKGQFFATYVGHAGPTGFTKVAHMWTMTDVQNTSFNHFPIWSTACCDVARYDSDQRGVAEVMFHKSDGGAIAMLTSSRMAFASSNDLLNRAFIRALFPYQSTHSTTTLGEAYRQAKNWFTSDNSNKLTFFLLGDPAMEVSYPKPLFQITKIDGKSVDSGTITTYPAHAVKIEAQVLLEDGTGIDSLFTGDAYASIYSNERSYGTVKGKNSSTNVEESLTVYHERELLGEVKGRVVNGIFNGTVVLPRYLSAYGITAMVRVYAHQDGTRKMVNGESTGLKINALNAQNAPTDDVPPVIEAMYFNDNDNLGDGAIVPSNSTLFVLATDNFGMATQGSRSVGTTVTMVLDQGKTTYSNVMAYATCLDEGRTLSIAYPVTNLADGHHTLTLTLKDAVGNSTKRTISFVVTQDHGAQLTVDDIMKIRGQQAEFSFDSNLKEAPEVQVKVTDALGRLVWNTTTTTFPVAWPLTDNEGADVAPGAYRFFATYSDGTNFGGTPIGHMVVLEPVPPRE